MSSMRMGSIRALLPMEQNITAGVDRDAFAVAFIRKHTKTIRAAIFLFDARASYNKDLFQDVCIHLLRLSREGILIDGPTTRSFLYIVVRNIVRSHQVRNQRHSYHLGDADEFVAGNDPSAFDQLVRTERHEALYKAIARLPMGEREVILMYLQNYSVAEIADYYERNEGWVKVKAHRARIRLRHLLTNPRLN